MPRLKNSRRQTKRKKQRAKQKLVVAMVSKTSLRNQKKLRKEAVKVEPELEAQSENEAASSRPKRTKPVKRLIEEESSQKVEKRKQKASKKTATPKRKKTPAKKTPQKKAAKRKGNSDEVPAAKHLKIEEDAGEIGDEFDDLNEYDDVKEPDEMVIVTTKSRQSTKGSAAGKAKKIATTPHARSRSSHILIENVTDQAHVHDSDDEEEAPDEDDDDIDDSLFFGIPTEKSPEVGTCTHCKKRFHREELAEHVASCPERYVQCRECNKVLSNLQTLERHHKRFHLKLREVPCTLCDKMFIDEAASRKHLKTVHFKVKNFHCPHCDKSFSQRNKLTYHVRTHSGEKPFSCPECGRAFSLLWNLKTHLRTHTGEKPYSCDICGRKFTQKQNMTSHMTTHKKPKLTRSSSYVSFSSAENLDYFSMSELRQAGKATMVQSSDGSIKLQHGRLPQSGHFLIDQIGNITPTTSGGQGASGSLGNDPENGLGLLSSVARKGDNPHEYDVSNVEVDGIVDEAHMTHQMSNNPAIDQVVEVLVQPQGGHGDTTISLTTADVGSVEHEAYIATSRIENGSEVSDVFQNKDPAVVTANASSLQQQQQAMSAQNVIPIGNANLSGLANILQNPEVLAAINAAAASNKFIVIGPVGMLSNSNAPTTSTVSISSAYSSTVNASASSAESDVNNSLCSSEAVASTQTVPAASSAIDSNAAVLHMSGVNQVESGLASPCNVEMIAADTSQDASVAIRNLASDETGNEVQSSVSDGIGNLLQTTSTSANRDTASNDRMIVNSEETQVQSSQDAAMYNVLNQQQNLEGEVSSSAGTNQSIINMEADAGVPDVDGTVQSTDLLQVQSSSMDNTVSSGNLVSSGGNVFYAVQQGNNEVLVSAAQPSGDAVINSNGDLNQQFIVTMKEQFVSSSGCTTSMAGGSLITSNEVTGGGQSMLMVTADGQSYFTAVNLPGALAQDENGQQIVLAPATTNALCIDPIAMSSVGMDNDQSTSSVFQGQLPDDASENCLAPGQSTDQKGNSSLELGDFAVTDSTARVYANSTNVDVSALTYSGITESDSSLEVSGSNNLQPDSMQSNLPETVSSDSTVDSQGNQADSIIESSQVFMLASAGNACEAQQSSFNEGQNVIAASSDVTSDSVVSGTENFVSSDLQESEHLEMQKTGVTSSNLIDNNAESTTASGNLSQDEHSECDQGDSQVSTSLQV